MRIDQLLHGYQDGHGRLAGSLFNLSPKDSARISMMSDWSGFRDSGGEDHSYITSYYLEDSGLYVIAKSWYAHEMERPGCVWTHSLLFDPGQLSPSFDIRSLKSLFIRPKKGDYGVYNKPIEIQENETASIQWEGFKPDRVSLMFILSTLLSGEESFYMKVELEPWWYQQFCLTILQYLSTEILPRISVSSGGASPRRIDNQLLSMQFVSSSDAISLLSPPWAGKLKESNFNVGLSFVARAMMGNGNDVSTLIRVFSKDIGNDGKKYLAICKLIGALFLGANKRGVVHYQDILNILISYFPGQQEGKLVKENFLRKRISSLFCSEDEFLFIVATTDHLEDHVRAEQIGLDFRVNDLAKDNDDSFFTLICRILPSDTLNAFGREILLNSYNFMDSIDIERLNEEQWRGLLRYLGDNQAYLLSNKWMGLRGERFNDVLWRFAKIASDEFPYWTELLKKILANEAYVDDAFIDRLYQNVEDCSSLVLDYLNANEKLLRYDNLHVRPFRDVETLVNWLSHQNRITSLVENLIVNYVWPSDYHIKMSDPQIWFWMIDNDNKKKSLAYYVFMYEIAWQWQGETVLKYYHHCFHRVHNGLADPTSSDRIWNRVYRYSGSVSILQEWDKCLRLKKGIVAHLKALGFSRSDISKLTPVQKINDSLIILYDKI